MFDACDVCLKTIPVITEFLPGESVPMVMSNLDYCPERPLEQTFFPASFRRFVNLSSKIIG
jgi:hypothetical protein